MPCLPFHFRQAAASLGTLMACSSVSIRAVEEQDLLPVAHILYDAFRDINTAVNVAVEIDFASLDVAIAALRARLADRSSEGVAAVEEENVVGVGFITYGGEVHSLSLIVVSPNAANKGIGKAITSALLEKSRRTDASSVRLVQGAPNTKSFSLYAKLGFLPVEYWNNFVGTISRDLAEAAAASIGISLTGYVVRQMEHTDVDPCAKLFKEVMGYNREIQIREKLQTSPRDLQVITKDGIVLGYTTGFTRSGYLVAADEESGIALYAAATHLHIYILGQLYPRLLRWVFEASLPLIRHGSVMALGTYQRPRQGMVWSPCGIN